MLRLFYIKKTSKNNQHMKSMTFCIQVTTIEHIFGYAKGNLLSMLFGTDEEIEFILPGRKKEELPTAKTKRKED